MVKKVMKKLRGREKGQALILALILLAVGSLTLVPLLTFMSSGLDAGATFEEKVDELYAADAGVQDAIWKINNLPDSLPGELEIMGDYYQYTEDEEPFVNGMDVGVSIEFIDVDANGRRYRVLSTADETTIDAVIAAIWLDYSGITDNVITSPNGYTLQGPTTVEPGEGEEHGPDGDYGGSWPTAEDLAAWYGMFVDEDNPYPYDEIDLNGSDLSLGPEYIDSEFYVYNSSNTDATLTLDGTLYITGNTEFGGAKDWTLNMNGQTIFVESDVTGGGTSGTAFWLGGKVTLTGSGCIIAVGDINFEPQMDCSPDDYILVLSVEGQTWMHPSGDFYGTLAGNSEVFIQNGDAYWTDPDTDGDGVPDVNFPGGSGGGGMVWGIHTWEIY